MVYLLVPYERISEAKELGAKFDWNKKLWYGNEDNICELQKLFKIYQPLNNIVGENRQFGGSKLYVDMVPHKSWNHNVRTYLKNKEDWDCIRKHVYERVNYRCECCGLLCKIKKYHDDLYLDSSKYEENKRFIESFKDNDPEYFSESMKCLNDNHNEYIKELQIWNTIQLEAHERWSYDDSTKVQKLERIIALCHRCHTVTHWGLAGVRGLINEAHEHLMKVNKYTEEDCKEHIKERTNIWRSLKEKYKLDLSILINSGFDTMITMELK